MESHPSLRLTQGLGLRFLVTLATLGQSNSAPAGMSPIRGLRRMASRRAGSALLFSCTSARPWAKVQRPGRSKSVPGLTAHGFAPRRVGPAIFLHLGPSLGQGAAPRPEQVRSGAYGAWLRAAPGWPCYFLAPRPVLGPRCSAPAGASPFRGLRRVASRRAGLAVLASLYVKWRCSGDARPDRPHAYYRARFTAPTRDAS